MNILDENIIEDQRQLLYEAGVRTRQIGQDVGHQGMKDQEHVLPLLHRQSRATFFTRDLGFYDPQFCHAKYCVVCLAVSQYEVARFVRRFLRHKQFNTWAKRQGVIAQVSHVGIRVWRQQREEELVAWANAER